jgi:uncharacterized coiled-coil DUF342 family protein
MENDLTKEQREVVEKIAKSSLTEVSTHIQIIRDVVKEFPEAIDSLNETVTTLKTESHGYDGKITGIGTSLDKKTGELHDRITREADKINSRIDSMWAFFIGTVVVGFLGVVFSIFALFKWGH